MCHGSPEKLYIYGLHGEEWSYSARDAAEMIRNSKEFEGKSIRLISCNTGHGENCIARQIACELGVDVLAPTEAVYINTDGEIFLTDNKVLAYLWNNGENVKETGEWILFRHGKE